MGFFKKAFSLFISLILIFSLTGCTRFINDFFGDSAEAENNERQYFDEFTEEFFLDSVSENTLFLHYTITNPENFGITEYPISLGSYSEEEIIQQNKKIDAWFDRLQGIDSSFLTDSQKLTYIILYNYLSEEQANKDLVLYYEPLSTVYGEHLNLPILFAEYAFNNEKDIEDYLALLNITPNYFHDILDFEKRKSEAGFFMADFTAKEVIKQCQDFISHKDDNYLILLFNEKIDAFSAFTPEEKNQLKLQNETLVKEKVLVAYQSLIDGLTQLLGTGKNQGGLSTFQKGKTYYEYLMRSEVGTDKSIREIKDVINKKMNQDILTISLLSKENPFLFDEMESTDLSVSDYSKTLENLLQDMTEYFPEGPEINYSVKKVHPSMADSLSPAFYLVPAIDNYKTNIIYVNGETDVQTLAHEGFPGHMYQTTFFSSTSPNHIRQLIDCTGYSEGWATYVEMFSYTISGIREDLAKAFDANLSYTLGIYCLADIGVHYEGWTRNQTLEYLNEKGFTNLQDQNAIFELIVSSPGNYLNYYVGYLEILELKEYAKKELDNQFNIKDFHQFLLNTGPAPFNIIKLELDKWIKSY